MNNIDYEKEYSEKSYFDKILNSLKTVVNTLAFIPKVLISMIYERNNVLNSDGLYLCIHGLKGDIYTLGHIIALKIPNNYDVMYPKIYLGGDCSLEESATPIYNLLLEYINKNPNKPIHIIATSNGCRIASFVETKLRNINVDIRITAIAGAYNGSRNINNFGFLLPLSSKIKNELKLNSEVNNMLKNEMMKKIEKGSRFYEFYGTANDLFIPNINDCFPDVVANEVIYHKLEEGYCHVSLGYYKSDEILNNSYEWMTKKINK